MKDSTLREELADIKKRLAASEEFMLNQPELPELPAELVSRIEGLESFAAAMAELLTEEEPGENETDRQRWLSAHQKARERRARERKERAH